MIRQEIMARIALGAMLLGALALFGHI